MIEFNSYVRNPLAPRIFVNDIGSIHRLDGGIMQVTFVQKFTHPKLDAVEQASLIWPEANWHAYRGLLQWVQKGMVSDTFRRAIGFPRIRAN
jgi:hypothetical protein